ncbi:MAG TPA: MarR family transcriptional regulator [Pseudonocardia sp.]|jgi:DNA-binding IclR family transcriptional regulator|nr:MarR family transcriptional regulator [Pseudonocardia sp.]
MPGADDAVLRDYVERFALVLTGMGMQRMSARVLALFVCTDAATLTGADIAGHLGVSPAAVSGAVRSLQQAGLLQRSPSPGSRRDHYRLSGDAWTDAGVVKRDRFDALARLADDGLALVEAHGEAAARLTRMRDFYAFLAEEIPALLDRWSARQPR